MNLFSRHPKSTVSLVFYAACWGYLVYWFGSGRSAYPYSCGAANGALIMFTVILSMAYSLTLLILSITSRGRKRIDYLLFLAIVLIPVILITLFII